MPESFEVVTPAVISAEFSASATSERLVVHLRTYEGRGVGTVFVPMDSLDWWELLKVCARKVRDGTSREKLPTMWETLNIICDDGSCDES